MVFQVNMKDGLEYVLDMAGTQYVWFDAVLNKSDFMDNRVQGIFISMTGESQLAEL